MRDGPGLKRWMDFYAYPHKELNALIFYCLEEDKRVGYKGNYDYYWKLVNLLVGSRNCSR